MNGPIPAEAAGSLRHPLPSLVEYESGTVPIRHSGWPPVSLPAGYPVLDQDIDTDIVVIGAGLAGASLALHLAERGCSVVLLEAGQPANGASGRNAGHVQAFLSNLEPLKAWPQQGKPFLDYFIQQRNIVFDLCQKYGIDGDAVKSGMVEASQKKQRQLEEKARCWQAFGYDVEVIEAGRLQGLLGTDVYRYGLHWREGGRVNPYLFTNGMVRAAQGLGVRVHGDSPVLGCEKLGQRWQLRTPQGKVRALKVFICTNGHAGNAFFPDLARTNYPLVACGMATKPLPASLLDAINPARVVLTQSPADLYPLVIDARNRMISATIPYPGRAQSAQTYFDNFLRYLHRTFPQTRDVNIELESYWTGYTASSSHVYHNDYPKLYQVDEGVMALMNLGTWGNLMGPLLGRNLAQAVAEGRPQDLLLPVEAPQTVRYPRLFEFKIRHLAIPVARLADRWFGIA